MTTTTTPVRTRVRGRQGRVTLQFYLFIAPWLVGLIGLTLGPMLFAAYASFTDWNGVGTPRWTGLDNYRVIFTADPQFLPSLLLTLYYAAGRTLLGVLLSLGLAALLNTGLPGRTFFRSAFYLPSVVTGVPLFIVWTYLFDPGTGVLNYLLGLVGITGPDWLGDPSTAMPSLILMGLTAIGTTLIVFLAGLQDIPALVYEAARVDGASWWRRFRYVTVPLLSPVILFTVVTGLIGSLQVFAEPYTMTGGGPIGSTYVYGLYLYDEAFTYFNSGYASALAWILFVIIIALTLLVFLVARGRVHYSGGTR